MYIAILIIEVFCVYFLFVETKGPTLEEIAILFDGPDAAVSDQTSHERSLQEKVNGGSVSHVEWSKQ